MNSTPRDDDAQSASDWLASQFGAEEPPPAEAPAVPPAAPAGTVPPAAPPATAPPATAPPAGGFTWGLQPGASSSPPVAPLSPADVPPAAVPRADVPPVAVPPADVPPPAVPPVEMPATAVPRSDIPPVTVPRAEVSPPAEPPQVVPPPAVVPPLASVPPAEVPPSAVPPTASAPPSAPPPTPPALVEPSAPPPTVAWSPPAASLPPAPTPSAAPTPTAAPAWDVPTQAMSAVQPDDPAATEPSGKEPAATERLPASELAATELLGSAEGAQDAAAPSALDSLFADENFRDYEGEPVVSAPPTRRREAAERQEPAGPISRTQKILLGVAGGLVALLALTALFLLGTRLPALIGPAAAPLPSSSPTPTPTPTELPLGPVDPGVWAWDELLGGECLDDYDDPWANEFTVVDCAEPHPAQLVFRGVFPPSAEGVTDDPFPGTEALHAQIPALCSAAGVVDLAAAGQYTDVQINGSYPATAEQWDAGERSYFCFVTRGSGEPLTGTLAVPPPPPAPPAEDEPAA